MMYPYMTLDDDTEITHSEMKPDGRVKVYMETPDEKVCFRHATCWLPGYKWEDVYAYSDADIQRFRRKGDLIMPRIFRFGSYWVYFWTNENKPLEPIHVHISSS